MRFELSIRCGIEHGGVNDTSSEENIRGTAKRIGVAGPDPATTRPSHRQVVKGAMPGVEGGQMGKRALRVQLRQVPRKILPSGSWGVQ